MHGSLLLIVLIYVDDIIVTGNAPLLISDLISILNSQFALKELGPISYFLGVEVTSTSIDLHFSQQKYINDLLFWADMSDCKPYPTPMASGPPLSLHAGKLLPDPTIYRSFSGVFQYCTITWPNLSYAVNKLYQFMHAPTTSHWKGLKRLLPYLKATQSHGLSFQSSPDFSLTAYNDAD